MEFYLVGGAVRDALLDLPVVERDWVVVGGDPASMRERGFVPADRDFPVFLDPRTGEEYALARRELKRGEGYRGFEVYAGPDVTLEEDLQRRDLTVNAMARGADGRLVDPYGGREDLEAGLLRHVSPAFVEDPLRVLRVARFAAKLGRHGFRVAHATHRLMCGMVERGDMAHLTPERLWREMSKAMQTAQPWRFFEVLQRCGALRVVIPALARAMGEAKAHASTEEPPPIAALKRISRVSDVPARRLAAVLFPCVASEADAVRLAKRLRADRDTAQLLKRAAAAHDLWARAERGEFEALFELAGRWRAFDGGSDFDSLLAVCAAQSPDSRAGVLLQAALPAARAVSVDSLRAQGLDGPALGEALAAARKDAMRAALRDAGLIT